MPLACVLGDIDLVRALGLAGIPSAVCAPRGTPERFSRFTRARLDWTDPWIDPDRLLDTLCDFGRTQVEPPVLYYEEDGDLLFVARHRERLATLFRFVVPDLELALDLVDKERFQALAQRLQLPVPPGRCLRPEPGSPAPARDLKYPLVVKPLTRRPSVWGPVGGAGKAVRVDGAAELERLWAPLAESRQAILIQELLPGPETWIESYHVYVDEAGAVVGEFTGRKLRTYPTQFGHSTALVTTDAADVRALGRELIERLGFRGVAKLDFKRAADGRLHLLEVNARFNLWHHLGARAGVNLPALVYRDLTGTPRTPVAPGRPGVRWCKLWTDARAARALGIPFPRWLVWALGAEAKRAVAWDDPLPLVGAGLRAVWRRLAGRNGVVRADVKR